MTLTRRLLASLTLAGALFAATPTLALNPADAGTYTRTQTKLAYVTVAASQTNQVLSATGAVGNILAGLIIIPASTSPGAVSITDGSGSAITVFTGGATSVADLKPFFVPLNAVSTSGGWKVTTGASVSVIAVGIFS